MVLLLCAEYDDCSVLEPPAIEEVMPEGLSLEEMNHHLNHHMQRTGDAVLIQYDDAAGDELFGNLKSKKDSTEVYTFKHQQRMMDIRQGAARNARNAKARNGKHQKSSATYGLHGGIKCSAL